MLEIINSEDFDGYDLKLESRFSDLKGFYDFVSLILECESKYDVSIFDNEAIFFESNNFNFLELHEFIIFIKTGFASEFVRKYIINNIDYLKDIRTIYTDYIIDNRNDKIDILLSI